MASKEKILQKLRCAAHSKDLTPRASCTDKEIFRDLPEDSPAARVAQFAERLRSLSGEFHAVKNDSEAAGKLLEILGAIENEKCLAQNHGMLAKIIASHESLSKRCDFLQDELNGGDFARYTAGLSVADFLVARTGSIVLRSTTAGGRRLSVLPPLHIVLAHQSQLVPSLDHALQAIETGESDWSYAAIITGPSRTADIQKNIVLGAHGPKRLAVVLVE
jgi:L-lactate dehydrogenase complex protein LldG